MIDGVKESLDVGVHYPGEFLPLERHGQRLHCLTRAPLRTIAKTAG